MSVVRAIHVSVGYFEFASSLRMMVNQLYIAPSAVIKKQIHHYLISILLISTYLRMYINWNRCKRIKNTGTLCILNVILEIALVNYEIDL